MGMAAPSKPRLFRPTGAVSPASCRERRIFDVNNDTFSR